MGRVRDHDRGQSSLVGSLVMAIVVALVLGAVGVQLFTTLQVEASVVVDLEPSATATDLVIRHEGGDAIDMGDAEVAILPEAGADTRFRLADASIDGDGDDSFEVGERASHPHGVGTGIVRVVVSWTRTGEVLLDERLSVPS